MAGLSAAGFTIKILQEVLDEIRVSQRNNIHPAIDTSSSRPLGQLNGVFAEREAFLWELLRLAYGAFDPDAAEGWLLDALCALTGTVRRPASRSLVTCIVNLDASATLPVGSTAHVLGQPLRLFRTRTAVVATLAGNYSVVFESVDTGPIPALAGTLSQIAGPVTGWNSVSNANDAALGQNEDTDTILRIRRAEALQRIGGSTPDAIRSDLLTIVGVEKVTVFENLSDTADVDGVPAHSIEVLVFDGVVPVVGNDLIAQSIWNSRAAGVRTYGNASGTAVDSEGNNQTVYFSRPTLRNVWLTVTVDSEGPTPATATTLLRDQLVSGGNEVLLPGVDVVALLLKCIVLDSGKPSAEGGLGFTWVHDVPTLLLGFSPSPTGAVNLIISPREIARLDTSRTTVTLV